jgi:hypothetical protein
MRRLLLPLLLLLAPAAQACSLVHQPFAGASWDAGGDLRYVDGARLQRVHGTREETLAEGFFLSYADGDGGMLLAGQTGLGAACDGVRWLRWVIAGQEVWERSGRARAFAHEDGPLAAKDGMLWRVLDGQLEAMGQAYPADRYVEGVTADGGPVYREGEALVVGPLSVPASSSESLAVAHNATATALALSGPGGARLLEVSPGGAVVETTWAAQQDQVDVAWAPSAGWVVAAGGRAFLVAGGRVTDLGVGAAAVGARGPQPVAFDDAGYTVFAGTRAVERWTRSQDGAWSAAPPSGTARPVSASSTSGEASPAPTPYEGPRVFGHKLLPGPPPWALVALLAVAAAGLRRRPPFEG